MNWTDLFYFETRQVEGSQVSTCHYILCGLLTVRTRRAVTETGLRGVRVWHVILLFVLRLSASVAKQKKLRDDNAIHIYEFETRLSRFSISIELGLYPNYLP